MTQIQFPPLSPDEAARLSTALGSGDLTVFADGTAVRLPAQVQEGIGHLLAALASGRAVTARIGENDLPGEVLHPEQADSEHVSRETSSGAPMYIGPEFLTTSQAAAAAGISLTYMRNLANSGEIPVEYRGTHRRFRGADVAAWVQAHRSGPQQTRSEGA